MGAGVHYFRRGGGGAGGTESTGSMLGFDTAHTVCSSSTRSFSGFCTAGIFACTRKYRRSILRILPALAVVWADTARDDSTLGFCTADIASTASISVVPTAVHAASTRSTEHWERLCKVQNRYQRYSYHVLVLVLVLFELYDTVSCHVMCTIQGSLSQ